MTKKIIGPSLEERLKRYVALLDDHRVNLEEAYQGREIPDNALGRIYAYGSAREFLGMVFPEIKKYLLEKD